MKFPSMILAAAMVAGSCTLAMAQAGGGAGGGGSGAGGAGSADQTQQGNMKDADKIRPAPVQTRPRAIPPRAQVGRAADRRRPRLAAQILRSSASVLLGRRVGTALASCSQPRPSSFRSSRGLQPRASDGQTTSCRGRGARSLQAAARVDRCCSSIMTNSRVASRSAAAPAFFAPKTVP